jgi:polyphosphate kinase
MLSESDKFKKPVKAISIVDEYLEHARVWIFHNGGKEKVYISSADWMVRTWTTVWKPPARLWMTVLNRN